MPERPLCPVILFAYNRQRHLQRAVESLLSNAEAASTQLIVFSDGSKDEKDAWKVDDVRHYLSTIRGFADVKVVNRPANIGLASNIILGVTETLQSNDRVIVMEDDLTASPYFLAYMNDALNLYENEDGVISVHGYMYPLRESLPASFFLGFTSSWGWATWKRGWDLFRSDGKALLHDLVEKNLTQRFDLDGAYPLTKMLEDQVAGKISSWAIRWNASACLAGKLSLYPCESLIFNVGNDSSGTHTGTTRAFDTPVRNSPIKLDRLAVREHTIARAALANFYREMPHTRAQRLIALMKGKPW